MTVAAPPTLGYIVNDHQDGPHCNSRNPNEDIRNVGRGNAGSGGRHARGRPARGAGATKQHEWLKRLEGESVTDSEALMGPGQPPVKSKGTEVVRSLGGFFTVGEIKSDFMGQPLTGIMTLGFDPQAKKYVGGWVCSVDGYSGSTRGRWTPPARC